MTRTTPYKSFKARTANPVKNGKQPELRRRRSLPVAAIPHQFVAGQPSANPLGRPKGSRNRFAEEFVKDFLTDWEEHGTEVLAACRSCDPAAYLKVAATLLPKDLNINMTDEAALDKLLNQFDDKQLSELIGTLASIGAAQALRAKTIEGTAITKPDKIH